MPSADEQEVHIPLEFGQSIQVSGSCNPNFVDNNNWSCEAVTPFCKLPVSTLIYNGSWNTNGIFETLLQCPQCGCGSEGAIDLNDHYAAEQAGSRKVSDVPEIMSNSTE